ncbi:MAG: nuclear transport factor 2 family protein [Gemmatimonadota bacterium]|nr:MAG: nuclear transport factor 2 family protein [Gemmatimonadota bacterium]
MRRTILAAFALCILAACQPTTTELTEEKRAAITDTVRQLADQSFDDFAALDCDRMMAVYSSDVVWAFNGVLATNRDSLVTACSEEIGSIQEVTSGDWGRVHIRVLGPDAAVFTATFDWAAVDTSGTLIGVPGVLTTVWARTTEGWQVVHGHESLPAPEPPPPEPL